MTPQTLEYFNRTKAQPTTRKPGNFTLFAVFEMGDAVSCISTVCHHVLHGTGAEYLTARLAKLNGKSLTIPQCQRVFKEWEKWTRGSSVPSVSQIQSFLLSNTFERL